MKKKITYYDILGIAEGSTNEEIKIAYIQKAKNVHPDINGNSNKANKKMALLNKAYQVLINPLSRQKYDKKLEQIRARGLDHYSEDAYTTDNKKQETEHTGMKWHTILFIIIIILFGVNLFVQAKLNNNNTPTVILTTSSNSSSINNSFKYPTAIPESTIDCTGPDGKHLYITQKACDDFNNAWKPTENLPPNNKPYGGNSCGVNSHLSYSFCICDTGYKRNHNTGLCDMPAP